MRLPFVGIGRAVERAGPVVRWIGTSESPMILGRARRAGAGRVDRRRAESSLGHRRTSSFGPIQSGGRADIARGDCGNAGSAGRLFDAGGRGHLRQAPIMRRIFVSVMAAAVEGFVGAATTIHPAAVVFR